MEPGPLIVLVALVTQNLTGENRCWPCTIANGLAGLVVGWLPAVAAVLEGEPPVVAAALVWAVGVSAFTVYRLAARGYLPLAEPVARVTGLHDRVGPGSKSERDERR